MQVWPKYEKMAQFNPLPAFVYKARQKDFEGQSDHRVLLHSCFDLLHSCSFPCTAGVIPEVFEETLWFYLNK